jgi:CubicO group peptidase (beta-lactamase class C family)
MPADIWSQMWADGAAPDARLKAVRALLARGPAQPPGTFVYSNAGYMIVGAALERIAGKPWEQILGQEIFIPLGMTSCGFGAPGASEPASQPWGHRILAPISPLDPASDNPPSLGPAGTVHCSLTDWGSFFALHLAAARGETTSLVSAAGFKRLQTPPAGGDYASGWLVVQRPWAGGTALTHSGSNTLWYATVWLAPAKDLAMAVVTNRGDDVAAAAVDSAFGPLIGAYAN